MTNQYVVFQWDGDVRVVLGTFEQLTNAQDFMRTQEGSSIDIYDAEHEYAYE